MGRKVIENAVTTLLFLRRLLLSFVMACFEAIHNIDEMVTIQVITLHIFQCVTIGFSFKRLRITCLYHQGWQCQEQ